MTGKASLFVYGTLLTHGANAHLLEGQQRHAARVRGTLYHLRAGYPALTLVGTEWVHGELVLELDERIFRLLDLYEGVDQGLYIREQTDVFWGLNRVPAYTYTMSNPGKHGGRHLKNGRWSPRRFSR